MTWKSNVKARRSWPPRSSSPPSNRPTAGAIGPPNPTALLETNCFLSSITRKPPCPTLREKTTVRGAGLFRYFRILTSSNGDDRRDVIAAVFRGVQNWLVSGYLLRYIKGKL